jgi:hypothetical protein
MRLLLLTALLLSANTALAETPAATKATPPVSVWRPAPARARPFGVWRPTGSGAYEHIQSGLICPARTATYARRDVIVFDEFGLDVGCYYMSEAVAVSYYLVRRSGGIEADLAQAKRDLVQFGATRHPQLLSESSYVQDGMSWSLAIYSEDGARRSGVWITDLGGWTFEFRAAYPVADEASMLSDIRVMAASVKASAGARLGLCAKAPRVEREGELLVDRIRATGGQIGKSAPAVEAPLVWCAEGSAKKGGMPLLFWRAVNADGGDALQERATTLRWDQPAVLSVAPDPRGDVAKTGSAPWIASMRRGGQVLVFGYFDDRPPVEDALDLFAGVLSGKAKAVGGYSVDGRNTNINAPEM